MYTCVSCYEHRSPVEARAKHEESVRIARAAGAPELSMNCRYEKAPSAHTERRGLEVVARHGIASRSTAYTYGPPRATRRRWHKVMGPRCHVVTLA